jgi:hypothetical protein
MTPLKILQTFVNRSDIYMIETPDYHGFKRNQLTLNCITNHLKGVYSLHIHALNKQSLCKWGCLDLDIHNFNNLPTDLRQMALKVFKFKAIYLSRLFPEFKTYIEFTGNRGYHIWVFFKEPKYAGLVRMLLGARLRKKKIYDVEIFPKQDCLSQSAPNGSTVRLPLGIHPKSNKRSEFINVMP